MISKNRPYTVQAAVNKYTIHFQNNLNVNHVSLIIKYLLIQTGIIIHKVMYLYINVQTIYDMLHVNINNIGLLVYL